MSRNILAEMKNIFTLLEKTIDEADTDRIVHKERHFAPEGDVELTKDFVKRAGVYKVSFQGFEAMVFSYKEDLYLLVPAVYKDALVGLGVELLNRTQPEGITADTPDHNDEIINGCEMLAITNEVLHLKTNLDSLHIIDRCLGMDECTHIFSELREEFFEESVVFKLDHNRFVTEYEEDLLRLGCYCVALQNPYFTQCLKEIIQEWMLMLSSRAIAASVLNGLLSPILEYTFLQLYQCTEYLFKLHHSFELTRMYGIENATAIDLVSEYEFKLSEKDNLRKVIFENVQEKDLDKFLDKTLSEVRQSLSKAQKCDLVSDHIYKVRCNVAHLRYGQTPIINDINWISLIEALAHLNFEIYEKLDNEITSVSETKKAWHLIQFIHK